MSAPVSESDLSALRQDYGRRHPTLREETVHQLIFGGEARNRAYDPGGEAIVLVDDKGRGRALPELSRILDERVTAAEDKRYYLCVPRD